MKKFRDFNGYGKAAIMAEITLGLVAFMAGIVSAITAPYPIDIFSVIFVAPVAFAFWVAGQIWSKEAQ